MSELPPEGLPAGLEPWCRTLRGDQAWRMRVPGGARALEAWATLRDNHAATRLWPVLLGPDPRVADQLTWRLDFLAAQAPGIPSADDGPAAADLFVRWLGDVSDDGYLSDVPRHLAKLQADEATIRERLAARPDEAAVRAVHGDPVELALVPADAGWEVPALLAWAGAEADGHGAAEHLSVLHFWHDAYGSELVALGLSSMELLVPEPPEDARSAFELAVQHYAYCPELMDNLAPAMGALAATLFGRHWLFDWS